MDKTEDTVRLIKEGYTEPEIRQMLGYKSGGRVYQIAKNYGLTITKPTEKKAKVVAEYRRQGYTIDYIAKEMGMTHSGVTSIIKRYAIPFTPNEEECECELCGKPFKRIKDTNKRFCSETCRAKASRCENRNADESNAFTALAKYNADWEYVGDYTGSDGFMTIRHSCGYVARKSCVTIRHRRVRCEACEEQARNEREKQREQQKAIEKEVAEFFKPTKKTKQTKMKECPVCGCFFFSSKAKYCSDKCVKKTANRYMEIRKRRRAKQAWTDESKTITLEKLYERDGGTCWLCGKQCDYSADPNSNEYPSIDHVFPIAKGGKDEWSNIRLAHRICNTLKGANIVEKDPVSIAPVQAQCG